MLAKLALLLIVGVALIPGCSTEDKDQGIPSKDGSPASSVFEFGESAIEVRGTEGKATIHLRPDAERDFQDAGSATMTSSRAAAIYVYGRPDDLAVVTILPSGAIVRTATENAPVTSERCGPYSCSGMTIPRDAQDQKLIVDHDGTSTTLDVRAVDEGKSATSYAILQG